MYKGYGILLKADCSVQRVKIDGTFEIYQQLVGGFFECVYPAHFPFPNVVFLVDDECKLKGRPVNWMGSAFYANPVDVLVGDVLILKLERVGEFQELDSVPFTREEADRIIAWILEYFLLKDE